MKDVPNPSRPEKEGPFLPRMNDGGILTRTGEQIQACCVLLVIAIEWGLPHSK